MQDRCGALTFDVLAGGPSDGELVLLLHGFPQGAGCWRDVVPALHAAGLRTLAPDQRGHSPGARPVGSAAYRARELLDDAVALLDAVGAARAHVVGHDWGGPVARGLGATVPERVSTLAVVSTPHPGAMRRAALHGQLLRSWYTGMVPGPARRARPAVGAGGTGRCAHPVRVGGRGPGAGCCGGQGHGRLRARPHRFEVLARVGTGSPRPGPGDLAAALLEHLTQPPPPSRRHPAAATQPPPPSRHPTT